MPVVLILDFPLLRFYFFYTDRFNNLVLQDTYKRGINKLSNIYEQRMYLLAKPDHWATITD